MPKHIYDETGRYRGEILSDSEHNKRNNSGGRLSKCFICDKNVGIFKVEGAWYKKVCIKCNKLSKKRIKSYLKIAKNLNRRVWGTILLFVVLLRDWNDTHPFENATYIGVALLVVVVLIFCWPLLKLKDKMKNEDRIK